MRKILLADDDQDMLSLMKSMLTKKGFTVLGLFKGKQVLSNIQTFQPDLVILDINFGDSDGREICNAIKSQENYNDIPIILYSAESWPDHQIADCKADAFIQKPFSRDLFLDKIEELIAA